MKNEFYVISFESTHYAIMMEKKLKEKYTIEMIPTPREITASCGLSIKITVDLFDDIIKDICTWDVDKSKFSIYKIVREKEEKRAAKINFK